MITLIDRQLIRGYFKAYSICLVSLLSLYVVVDLFTHLDDFTGHKGGLTTTVRLIGLYYGFQLTRIFDRLCEVIVLMAAMFTVSWMQRGNEQMPLLSAGVSTRRIVLPVVLSACLMLTFTLVNQEFIIPRVAHRLAFQRDDPDGRKDVLVKGAYEPNGIVISGLTASLKDRVVRQFECTIPDTLAEKLTLIRAEEARYVPPGPGPRTGGWELTGADEGVETWDKDVLEVIDRGKYFLKVQRVDFEALTRRQDSYLLSSTLDLYRELQSPEAGGQASASLDRKRAVLFHSRLTRPVLGVLLVLLGLSTILRDQNRNVFLSAGMCLVLCAVFFAVTFFCKYLGDKNLLAPALAAWLPILLFGPLAVVRFDAVHT